MTVARERRPILHLPKVTPTPPAVAPPPASPVQRPVVVTPPAPRAPKKVRQRAEARQGVRQALPLVFAGPIRPFAVGIVSEMIEALPDVTRWRIREAVRYWTNSLQYLDAVAQAGSRRYHLDGSDAGPVTEEHRLHAKTKLDEMETKLRKMRKWRKKRDAAPK